MLELEHGRVAGCRGCHLTVVCEIAACSQRANEITASSADV